jgi:NDP-sugar pyrophosphorylase family protein
MSGFGERFRRAGYSVPKPLIEIEGKPIIGHVIDMFPGETDFVFICNKEHLEDPSFRMEKILRKLCPSGKILGITPHKLGPVHAVMQVRSHLKADVQTIINYCDFTCYWDWRHFKKFVESTGCIGAIPAYKGFHPHSLNNTNYAYMLEQDGWVKDIQEKCPYTKNRMNEFASSGTYYFASGKIALDACEGVLDQMLDTNGEYYVSLAYKVLLQRGEPVAVYPLQHFMQWGTPGDVGEYNRWSDIFTNLVSRVSENHLEARGSIIIPLAGLGKRFADEGYKVAKPLIEVSGVPMVIQATRDLPPGEHYSFVVRSDMAEAGAIAKKLVSEFKTAEIVEIDSLTDGQACTALLGLDAIPDDKADFPITVGACDNGVIFSHDTFQNLLEEQQSDVVVWGVRSHPHAMANPEMYGWIDENDGKIAQISVKKPISENLKEPVVLGIFTFRNARVFRQVVERLISRNGRVNGEFYLDSCIEDAVSLGLNCTFFEVEHFLCWGTPNDLMTFQYWQSCFHKWSSHDYELQKDLRVPREKIAEIDRTCRQSMSYDACKTDD